MSDFFDVWIARVWGCSPEDVRSWPEADVQRCLVLLEAEGMLAKKRAS